jgi:hypothetical protein
MADARNYSSQNTNTTSKLSFKDLPSEIHLLLFHLLPTTSTFLSLVLTSRYYYKLYLSNKNSILRSLAYNVFQPVAIEVLNMWRRGGLCDAVDREAFRTSVPSPTKPFKIREQGLSPDLQSFGPPEMWQLVKDRERVMAITRVWVTRLSIGDDYYPAEKDSPVLKRSFEENMQTLYEFVLLPSCIIECYGTDGKRIFPNYLDHLIQYERGIHFLFDFNRFPKGGEEYLLLLIQGVMGDMLPLYVIYWWGLREYLKAPATTPLVRALATTNDRNFETVKREVLVWENHFEWLKRERPYLDITRITP